MTEGTAGQEYLFNQVTLVGRAGSDAELKYFGNNGKAKAHVTIAVSRGKNKNSGEEQTDWFRIEFWDRDAEIAGEYVKKGTLIGIDGRLAFQQWTDAKTGEQRSYYAVTANALRLLSSKKERELDKL